MRIASHRFAGLLFNLFLLPGPRFPKIDRNWWFCIFAPLLVKVRGFSLLDLGMLVFSKVDAQSRRPGCVNGEKRTSVVIINSHWYNIVIIKRGPDLLYLKPDEEKAMSTRISDLANSIGECRFGYTGLFGLVWPAILSLPNYEQVFTIFVNALFFLNGGNSRQS